MQAIYANLPTILLSIPLFGAMGAAVFYMAKRKKEGQCAGCDRGTGGGCPGCTVGQGKPEEHP